ncbi:MAG: FIST C-terminal domain-containing protein [Deltaproteobacteria bacterium]|nr:FIST C-terminal domain-containing protein [Deltaproteobacteria bacterium]
MRWASAIATPSYLGDALAEAAEIIGGQLDGRPDLIFAFVSGQHESHFERFPVYMDEHFPGSQVVGCSAGGVIGGAREIEGEAAVSLTAAVLPDVEVRTFHLGSDSATWALHTADTPELVVLSDPFSCDSTALLDWIDQQLPDATTIGGVASGASSPGGHALFAGDKVHRTGAVGVSLVGNVEVDTIVAQGCRPIGQPMFVTRAERNVILELDGQPALAALELMHAELTPDDQRLLRTALHLGVVMEESHEVYEHGDFLIRNIHGIDPKASALAVDTVPHAGQVVQFHLRDASSSADELSELLSRHHYAEPAGALLFSCLGRGKRFYGEPNHDSGVFTDHFGPVPLGGFFGNGEIGPVHGKTFVHGYTSSFGLFRPKQR